MTKQEFIDKWEKDLKMWRHVAEEPLMYTNEERIKAIHYSTVIATILLDFKKITE